MTEIIIYQTNSYIVDYCSILYDPVSSSISVFSFSEFNNYQIFIIPNNFL